MRRIVLLAVPPIQILDLTGPYEIFARCGGYRVEMVSTEPGGLVSSTCGLSLAQATHYSKLRGLIDTILVVGGEGIESGLANRQLLKWLRAQSGKVRRIGSICTGAFLLAAAGILDHRRAVTHWKWCEALALHFPKVTVEQDPIFIKDGKVYTSAGITAGFDLTLSMIEEDFGRHRALEIARDLVMFLRRQGGQSQFSAALSAQASESRPIEDLVIWILEHLDADLSVEALAERCGMSPRTFARVFAREKGVTPARFVARARVEAARSLIEESARGVKETAAQCGFGSADSMRRLFLRVLGITASEYADRFRPR